MLLTLNSGVKWSENAADYRENALEESRKVLRGQLSVSIKPIQLDLYITAMGAFRDVTRLVRTPHSFSANLL
jgi:hypothetical protein